MDDDIPKSLAEAETVIKQPLAFDDDDHNFGMLVVAQLRELLKSYAKDKARIDILQLLLQAKHGENNENNCISQTLHTYA